MRKSVLIRKKRKKETWFKYIMSLLHLWIGLITGVLIVVISLSGMIYVFRDEGNTIYNREVVYAKEEVREIASIDGMVTDFEFLFQKSPFKVLIPLEKDKNIVLYGRGRGKDRLVTYFDRKTGHFVGKANTASYDFFSWMLRLHRSLLIKDFGRDVVAITVLLFLFMLISGLVMWFPTKKKKVKAAFLFKKKSKMGRFIYDLHNVLGFYSTFILLLITITGLCFSFTWFYKGTLATLSVHEKQQVVDVKSTTQSVDEQMEEMLVQELKNPSTNIFSYDDLLHQVGEKLPYDGQIAIRTPSDRSPYVSVKKYNLNNWLGLQVQDEVIFLKNGSIESVSLFKDKKLFQQFSKLLFPLHTGEICGLPSKIIYFLLALISASLPVTGFLIWWRKSRSKILKSK